MLGYSETICELGPFGKLHQHRGDGVYAGL